MSNGNTNAAEGTVIIVANAVMTAVSVVLTIVAPTVLDQPW